MATVTRILLALLNAVPVFIQAIKQYQSKKHAAEQAKVIDDDPLGEFANRFGELRDDTYSDPAARCLCDTTSICGSTNSPGLGGGAVSEEGRCGKATEVH